MAHYNTVDGAGTVNKFVEEIKALLKEENISSYNSIEHAAVDTKLFNLATCDIVSESQCSLSMYRDGTDIPLAHNERAHNLLA